MRFTDLLKLPLVALWQQKVRTLLTTLGVVFGSFVLAASLSIGQGVQDTIERMSHRSDFLRKIRVGPAWGDSKTEEKAEQIEIKGEMQEDKRDRIRKATLQSKQRFATDRMRIKLTREKLQELAALPHVESVVPVIWQYGTALIDGQAQAVDIGSGRPVDVDCQRRLVAGRLFESSSETAALVSEFLLYRLGLTDDDAVKSVVGRTLRLEFRPQHHEPGFSLSLRKSDDTDVTREELAVLDKIRAQLPTAVTKLDLNPADLQTLQKAIHGVARPTSGPFHADFKIVGVLRLRNEEEQKEPWDPLRVETEVVLPFETATDLYFRVPGQNKQGIGQAIVIVDDEQNAKEVFKKIAETGLSTDALLEYIERERLMYLMIFGGMTCVAAVALLVAALGIANTMLMSVLERTREIGIMKAVGAGNGHLQFIFLAEGALIGISGGVCGLLLAWGASFPGDAWVRTIVTRDLKIDLEGSIFAFPPWLIFVVVSFAVLVTTLAAVFPARRAARIDPVRALRHE
ncbi:MAG: ytrF 1 [Planctomycetaceae bacterium]|nr:ytrF 1 [Planctomycetaceae bacterium]